MRRILLSFRRERRPWGLGGGDLGVGVRWWWLLLGCVCFRGCGFDGLLGDWVVLSCKNILCWLGYSLGLLDGWLGCIHIYTCIDGRYMDEQTSKRKYESKTDKQTRWTRLLQLGLDRRKELQTLIED